MLPASSIILDLLLRLPPLLADADDVVGFVIFIVIGAIMLIFKALATARQNAQRDGSSREQIARSIRAKRPQIQERAAEIRRQRPAVAPPPAMETHQQRRERLRHERLLQRQGRAADARTEYDLIRQRREAEQATQARHAPQVQMQQHPQQLRQSRPAQRPVTPRSQPAAGTRPQQRPQQGAVPVARLVPQQGRPAVPQSGRATAGSTAPITAASVADRAVDNAPSRGSKAAESLAGALRRRMKGNQLREYLVAAEVLGKPISLRDQS